MHIPKRYELKIGDCVRRFHNGNVQGGEYEYGPIFTVTAIYSDAYGWGSQGKECKIGINDFATQKACRWEYFWRLSKIVARNIRGELI